MARLMAKGVSARIIIITGVSDDFQNFISSRRQVPPPEGYVRKPVDAVEFMNLVKSLLGEAGS